MSGAGSAEIGYRLESGFGSAGTGDWFQPGTDVTLTNFTIDNEATRNRQPDDTTPSRSRVGNFVGQMGVSWTLTDDNWHDLVPFSGSPGSLSGPVRIPPTAEWYLSATAIDNTGAATFSQALTVGRAAVTEATVNYQEGEDITVDTTIAFGDLTDNTPSSITQPADSDVFTHHGTSLTVDSTAQASLQTATLTMSNLARRVEQQDRKPFSMVTGAMTPEFSTDATFTETDQLEMAISDTSSTTSIADQIDGAASGSLEFTNGAGDTISYTLSRLQPTTYQWSDLINPDGDLTEPIDYHIADVGLI
jgi:hypothetical protein